MATPPHPTEPTRVVQPPGGEGATPGSPRRYLGARDLAQVAVFAALIVVLGLPGSLYPFGAVVPITLQSMGVMLAGVILGARRGAAATGLVLVLCAIGLPVLSAGKGGLAPILGPSGGYLFGWVLGAAVTGWFATRRAPRFSTPWAAAGALVGGILVVHALGVPGMMWRGGMTFEKALLADLVFLPGDLVKAGLAVVVGAAVHRAVPGLYAARAGR